MGSRRETLMDNTQRTTTGYRRHARSASQTQLAFIARPEGAPVY